MPSAPSIRNSLRLVLPALLLLLLLLGPALTGPFFCDDFQFRLENPAALVTRAFITLHPYRLYRPLQLELTALSQALCGPTTLPVHLVNVLVHGALLLLVLRAVAGFGGGRVAARAAALLFVTAPLCAPALGSNDTTSTVLATLAGSAALWWMRPTPAGPARPGRALLAFGVALFSKETALGYAVPLMGLAGWSAVEGALRGAAAVGPPEVGAPAPRRSLRRGLGPLLALPLMVIPFLAWRATLGGEFARFGAGGGFRLALNVPVNLLMLEMVPWLPLRTLDVFSGVVEHRPLAPLLAVAAALCWGGLVALAWGRHGRWWQAALLLALATGGLLPTLPMRRVSELYAYGLLPVVALLSALAFERLHAAAGAVGRACLVAALLALGLCQARSLAANARDMAANGVRAGAQLAELEALLDPLPPGTLVYFVEPALPRPDYSLFRMGGFRLTPAGEVARLLAARGLDLRPYDPPRGDSTLEPGPALFVTLRAGHATWCARPGVPPAEPHAAALPGPARLLPARPGGVSVER